MRICHAKSTKHLALAADPKTQNNDRLLSLSDYSCKQESSHIGKTTSRNISAPISPEFVQGQVCDLHTMAGNGVPSSSSSPHWTIPADRVAPRSTAAGFIEVQLQSLCRICAKVGDSMVDIYDQIFAEDYQPALDQWINDYLPINVSVNRRRCDMEMTSYLSLLYSA